eukprot:2440354-Pyramimonas_sp.AAC.1
MGRGRRRTRGGHGEFGEHVLRQRRAAAAPAGVVRARGPFETWARPVPQGVAWRGLCRVLVAGDAGAGHGGVAPRRGAEAEARAGEGGGGRAVRR